MDPGVGVCVCSGSVKELCNWSQMSLRSAHVLLLFDGLAADTAQCCCAASREPCLHNRTSRDTKSCGRRTQMSHGWPWITHPAHVSHTLCCVWGHLVCVTARVNLSRAALLDAEVCWTAGTDPVLCVRLCVPVALCAQSLLLCQV